MKKTALYAIAVIALVGLLVVAVVWPWEANAGVVAGFEAIAGLE